MVYMNVLKALKVWRYAVLMERVKKVDILYNRRDFVLL